MADPFGLDLSKIRKNIKQGIPEDFDLDEALDEAGNPLGIGKTGGVHKFLFGETKDPGGPSREALEKFGTTGELGGQSTQELLNSIIGGQRSEERMATGQRLARAGLTGSGIAEDIMQDRDLSVADQLRRARLDLISQRLRALGITGRIQPQRQPGFFESAIPSFAQGYGQGSGEN